MAMNPGLAAFIAKKKGGSQADPKAKGGNPFAKGGKPDAASMRSDKLKQIAGGK